MKNRRRDKEKKRRELMFQMLCKEEFFNRKGESLWNGWNDFFGCFKGYI